MGHPLKDTILRLGNFLTLMNLLGAIGTLIEGYGLDTLLEEIYGENAVIYRGGSERGQDNTQGSMEEYHHQLYRRPQMTGQARE